MIVDLTIISLENGGQEVAVLSEYQFVAFRAVDRPLTQRELVYARQQSSRAEITRWHFENEYHFGDFRGSADGLLRHGYDVHLHYANFGIRKIAVRLPSGLPFPASVWSDYVGENRLTWKKDSRGTGGILTLELFHEPGDLEEIWSPGEYLDDVVEIRNRLVAGDLRVLYLLWLCAANDQSASPELSEPRVPGGLDECLESFGALLELFGLDPLILVAASEDVPASLAQEDHEQRVEAYVEAFSDRESKRLLRKLLVGDAAVVKAEMLAGLRESQPRTDWPTVALGRSFGALLERTEGLRAEHDAQEQRQREDAARREAAKQERKRQDRMKLMVKAPQKWLREAEKLVAARGTHNYKAAAEILSDLREAVGGEEGAEITRMHAAHLAKKHPTLNHLKSSLRKYGLLE